MTGFAPAVRDDNSKQPAIVVVIGAVAASLVENNKSFVTQQGMHLGKSDAAGGASHLFN